MDKIDVIGREMLMKSYMENTLLWVNMIFSEAKCADEDLLYVRRWTAFERRGGLFYMKNSVGQIA